MKNIAGASGGGQNIKPRKNIEYIHLFAKNHEKLSPYNPVYSYTELYSLIQYYRNNNISWKYTSILYDAGEKEYLCSTMDGKGDEIKIFERANPSFKSVKQVAEDEDISEKEAYYSYIDKIFTTAMPQSSIRGKVLKAIEEENQELNRKSLYSIEYIPQSGRHEGEVYEKFYKGNKLRLVTWLKDVVEERKGSYYKKKLRGNLWDGINLNNLFKEGGVSFQNGKKPEELVKNILKLYTERGDLVLDFFAGSGTTGAVAHKMDRKWIMVEQLDYCDSLTKQRMLNVLDGDDTGISTDADVNWNGGGSFKYIELNESFEYSESMFRDEENKKLTERKKVDLESTFSFYFGVNVQKKDLIEFEDGYKVLVSFGEKREGESTLLILKDIDKEDFFEENEEDISEVVNEWVDENINGDLGVVFISGKSFEINKATIPEVKYEKIPPYFAQNVLNQVKLP